jgi:hypothetical protein
MNNAILRHAGKHLSIEDKLKLYCTFDSVDNLKYISDLKPEHFFCDLNVLIWGIEKGLIPAELDFEHYATESGNDEILDMMTQRHSHKCRTINGRRMKQPINYHYVGHSPNATLGVIIFMGRHRLAWIINCHWCRRTCCKLHSPLRRFIEKIYWLKGIKVQEPDIKMYNYLSDRLSKPGTLNEDDGPADLWALNDNRHEKKKEKLSGFWKSLSLCFIYVIVLVEYRPVLWRCHTNPPYYTRNPSCCQQPRGITHISTQKFVVSCE